MMKKLAIGLAVALSLTAVAASSASASQRSFTASQYPAVLSGISEGEVYFSTRHNGGRCEEGVFGAALPSAKPIAKAEIGMKCTKFGIYPGELKDNGCQFEFNADYNTVSIGPAGCGPMSIKQETCTTYILPQNGIPATYEAGPTAGGYETLRVSLETSKLKYKECNSSSEVREDGFLSMNFQVFGFGQEGNQISVSLKKPEYLNFVSAEKYPASLVGNSTAGEAKFSLEAGTVRCSKTTYAGTQASVWEYAEVVPTFSECIVFGFANGVVNSNGCKFGTSAFMGWEEIACPEGKVVTISIPGIGCAASIGSQGSLLSGTVTNTTGANGRSALNVSFNTTGLTYTVTDDSFFACGFQGVGTKSGGTFTDKALIEGQDSAGPIAIKVGA
jgi:hypothetical protein